VSKRATFTQAELTRAIRAAEAAGKVALQTPAGIAFVDPQHIAQSAPTPTESGGNSCDGLFGAAR
jgi:hypothetical protein